ncbi:hypothetical protein OIU79_025267 [Salix purpurea]|uniref:Uncharacterized protein n=1 Tax=Salix purpurea TaxID=77065 RepID=A0A9Q0W4H9_SALPP|nr:hypothetical protein OIU79_025267 [Salix purpurea]
MYDVEYYQFVSVFILVAIKASHIPIISLMFSNLISVKWQYQSNRCSCKLVLICENSVL